MECDLVDIRVRFDVGLVWIVSGFVVFFKGLWIYVMYGVVICGGRRRGCWEIVGWGFWGGRSFVRLFIVGIFW